MTTKIVPVRGRELAAVGGPEPPAIVKDAGKPALFAYAEFFGAQVENDHTLAAYRPAADRFLGWCDEQGLELRQVHAGTRRRLDGNPRQSR